MKGKFLKIGAFIALILMFLLIVSSEMSKLVNPFSLIVLVLGTTLLTIITYQKPFAKKQLLSLISRNLIIVGCLTFIIGFVIALSSAKNVTQMGQCISVSAIVLIYMLLGLIVIKFIQELTVDRDEKNNAHQTPPQVLLTQREKEISAYILKGVTNKEIAESLFVSESTVKKQITQLFKKLEVKNRYELISKLNNKNIGLDDH